MCGVIFETSEMSDVKYHRRWRKQFVKHCNPSIRSWCSSVVTGGTTNCELEGMALASRLRPSGEIDNRQGATICHMKDVHLMGRLWQYDRRGGPLNGDICKTMTHPSPVALAEEPRRHIQKR